MLKRIKWLIATFTLVTLAGCANTIDYGEASLNLELGMPKSEVVQLLGKPKRTDVNESRERWFYWNKEVIGFTPIDNEMLASDKLVVTFKNGHVVDWGKNAYMKDAMDVQQKIMEGYMPSSNKSDN
ncbi:MAG: outer membrane protein assembly factor BamE domain-containing protein [Pseudomonadota bacterium]